jgi:hypothetical protein
MTTKMTVLTSFRQQLHNESHTTSLSRRTIASSIGSNTHRPDSTIIDARLATHWLHRTSHPSITTALEDHEIRETPVLELAIRQRPLENERQTLRFQFSLRNLVDIAEIVRDVDEWRRAVSEL